jgi:hypothetical protein
MSLNLNDRVPIKSTNYDTSPTYTDAVNDSRFVRTFGMISLVGSIILIFLGGAVAIGIGLAVLGFGSTRYYRLLGLAVVVLGALGILLSPLKLVATIVLSVGIAVKAMGVLKTLASEGKGDPDWGETRTRALTGLGLSAAGFVVSGILLILSVIGMLLQAA